MDEKATKVVYYVNGVASNMWRRLSGSKTFWICASFVLVAAERWNRGEISGGQFYQIAQVGVMGILIRAAMTKAELAANATNPAVDNVRAVEVEKKGPNLGGPVTGLFMALLLPFMPGCDYAKQATLYDENGQPIKTPARIGITLPLPTIETVPDPKPTPAPALIDSLLAAPAQPPILPPVPPAKDYAGPLGKPVEK